MPQGEQIKGGRYDPAQTQGAGGVALKDNATSFATGDVVGHTTAKSGLECYSLKDGSVAFVADGRREYMFTRHEWINLLVTLSIGNTSFQDIQDLWMGRGGT